MTKIIYKQGNLLDCTEPFILHGCNAQGVMGSGVALAIKQKYRHAFEVYRMQWERGLQSLGSLTYAEQLDGKTIINGITQKHYGRGGERYVDYDAVREVMKAVDWFVGQSKQEKLVAMPRIGAGLGGGDWNFLSRIIEEESASFTPVVYVL